MRRSHFISILHTPQNGKCSTVSGHEYRTYHVTLHETAFCTEVLKIAYCTQALSWRFLFCTMKLLYKRCSCHMIVAAKLMSLFTSLEGAARYGVLLLGHRTKHFGFRHSSWFQKGVDSLLQKDRSGQYGTTKALLCTFSQIRIFFQQHYRMLSRFQIKPMAPWLVHVWDQYKWTIKKSLVETSQGNCMAMTDLIEMFMEALNYSESLTLNVIFR